MTRAPWVACASLVAALGTARSAAAELQPRVLVLPAEGSAPPAMPKLGGEIADALVRGAARTTPNVARADASLADTAVIVGCDPSASTCLDAVAAALNVDQLVFAHITTDGDGADVAITAVTRETEPQTRTFAIHAASQPADLAAIEPAVVEMLDSGEARRTQAHHDAAAPPAPLPPTPPAPAITLEGERPAWPVIVTSAGAAAVIVGASCWAIASSKQADIDRAPTATADDLNALASLETSARRYATAGNVLFVGGAVVTVAGAALWWRAWHGEHAIAVAPSIGPDHAALFVGGVW